MGTTWPIVFLCLPVIWTSKLFLSMIGVAMAPWLDPDVELDDELREKVTAWVALFSAYPRQKEMCEKIIHCKGIFDTSDNKDAAVWFKHWCKKTVSSPLFKLATKAEDILTAAGVGYRAKLEGQNKREVSISIQYRMEATNECIVASDHHRDGQDRVR